MEPARDKQLAHLQCLADDLTSRNFTAWVHDAATRPYLRAASPGTPELTERVFCRPAADGSWCFWWPWKQPIGSAEDVASVSGKIMTVLSSIEEASDRN
jgi:hypothetical protein